MHSFMKEYKAYIGLIGFGIIILCIIPYLAGLLAILQMIITGEANKLTMGYIVMALLFILPGALLFCLMVARTALILNDEGIIYRGIKFHRWNIFKSKEIEIKSPWDAIRTVKWMGAVNGPLLIQTDSGDIKFWVIFHDATNKEIMQNISAKVSHLENVSN